MYNGLQALYSVITTTSSFLFSKLNPIINTASYRVGGSIMAGYSMRPLFAYQFAGLDTLGDPQIYINNGKDISKKPGAALVDDVVYKGTTQPRYMGSISNTISYKGLSLMANIIYSGGAVMRRSVNTFYTGVLANRQGFQNANYRVWFLDRWKKPGDEQFTNTPSFVASEDVSYSRRDVYYFVNGDLNVISSAYAKLRDITLTYSLRAKALEFLKMQGLSIYGRSQPTFCCGPPIKKALIQIARAGQGRHGYALGVNVNF